MLLKQELPPQEEPRWSPTDSVASSPPRWTAPTGPTAGTPPPTEPVGSPPAPNASLRRSPRGKTRPCQAARVAPTGPVSDPAPPPARTPTATHTPPSTELSPNPVPRQNPKKKKCLKFLKQVALTSKWRKEALSLRKKLAKVVGENQRTPPTRLSPPNPPPPPSFLQPPPSHPTFTHPTPSLTQTYTLEAGKRAVIQAPATYPLTFIRTDVNVIIITPTPRYVTTTPLPQRLSSTS